MSCTKPIGRYFGLELNSFGNNNYELRLNSGRASLFLILKSIKPKKVYLPYYTCDVVKEPIDKLNIECVFYRINQKLQPLIDDQQVDADSVVIVNNYFGILDSRMEDYYLRFGDKLIIDNSQAFFHYPDYNVNAFYSPRKFMGLPDGGFVKLNSKTSSIASELYKNMNVTYSHHLMEHLYKRIDLDAQSAYSIFKENDRMLSKEDYGIMSKLTYSLYQNIDLEKIRNTRLENFKLMHKKLNATNKLSTLIDSFEHSCPMVYPFLHKKGQSLKQNLIKYKVFVATYWPNVEKWMNDKNSIEIYLVKNLVALPIDQRLGEADVNYICELIINEL